MEQGENLISLLLVGQAGHCTEIKQALKQSSLEHKVFEAASCEQAKEHLAGGSVTVVLCEQHLTDGTWQSVLNHAFETNGKPSVVVCSRNPDQRLWAEVLNLGGHDVLSVQPLVKKELVQVIESAHRSCPRKNLKLHPRNTA